MNRTGAQLISLQSCSSSGLQAEDNVNVITMLPRWRLVHDLVGRVVLGRCGTHFGVQESMHWTSKLRKCEGRVGRGLCCVGGGEPCFVGLWLAQAPPLCHAFTHARRHRVSGNTTLVHAGVKFLFLRVDLNPLKKKFTRS